MKNRITVSKELALQLKQAGFPQEGYFGYYQPFDEMTISNYWKNFTDGFAAPTAEEILEMLPFQKDADFAVIGKDPNKQEWVFDYKNELFRGETLAEAAGKMWLYLKENHLLKTDTNEAKKEV